MKRNVPFNSAQRIGKIVIEEKLRNERLKELRTCLIKRHYTAAVVDYGTEKAKISRYSNIENS